MSEGPRLVPSAPARVQRSDMEASGHGISAGLSIVFGVLAALIAVAVFVALDYRFAQAPHRIVKLLIGGAMMVGILLRPRFGLFLIPIVTPFLPWVPALPIPGVNLLNILLGSVFVTWTLGRVLKREPVFRSGHLSWALLTIVLMTGLAVFRGGAFPTGYHYDTVSAGLQWFRATVSFAAYFIVLSMVRGERDRRWMAAAVMIGLLAEAVATIAFGRSGSGGRAVGSIGQSNDLGAFLAIYTVAAAALLVGVRSLWSRLVLAFAVVTGVVGIVLSVSRGAIVAVVVALGWVALRSSRLLTFALVAILLTSPWWAPDYLKDRIMGTQVVAEDGEEVDLDGAAQMRVDTWRAIGQLVTDHPLIGVGFGGLEWVLPQTGDAMGIEVKDSAHSTFLRFLSEMGVFGLIVFALLLWRCWTLALAGMRAAHSRFDRQLALGLSAATVALTISCIFGDRFFNILVSGSFWVLCALVDDLIQEQRRMAA